MRRVFWLLAPVALVTGCVSHNAYTAGSWYLDSKSVPGQLPLDDTLATMSLGYGGGVSFTGINRIKGAYSLNDSTVTMKVLEDGIPGLLPAVPNGTQVHLTGTLRDARRTLDIQISNWPYRFHRAPSGSWVLDPKSAIGSPLPPDSDLAVKFVTNGTMTIDESRLVKGSYSFNDPAATIVLPSEGIPGKFPAGSKDGVTTIHGNLNVDGNSIAVIIEGNSYLFLRDD